MRFKQDLSVLVPSFDDDDDDWLLCDEEFDDVLDMWIEEEFELVIEIVHYVYI
ncbi:sORF1 [Sparus aurata papillomavirus 1]|uniref:SORF1 n=1 Tax=Sparus aurata papillomavirus 1 TaxID=1885928 RepID=A0A1B2RW93_9PAPI|nr:sORF1 [Sparus aurata papillomavirus 1]AOC55273.1 sORF1 [Sparus aurata papillomavirus 1]